MAGSRTTAGVSAVKGAGESVGNPMGVLLGTDVSPAINVACAESACTPNSQPPIRMAAAHMANPITTWRFIVEELSIDLPGSATCLRIAKTRPPAWRRRAG